MYSQEIVILYCFITITCVCSLHAIHRANTKVNQHYASYCNRVTYSIRQSKLPSEYALQHASSVQDDIINSSLTDSVSRRNASSRRIVSITAIGVVVIGIAAKLIYRYNKAEVLNTISIIKTLDNQLPPVSNYGSWKYFFAGALCAAYSHGITTPIDVVKTKMQQLPDKYPKNVLHASKMIVQEEGIFFLLQGIWPTIIGYGIEGALKFGCYETLKRALGRYTPYKLLNFVVASVAAGFIASLILCPMEETRIRMVSDKTWHDMNFFTAMWQSSNGNFMETFDGLNAMLCKQIPYTISKQVFFDMFAELFYSYARFWSINTSDVQWVISLSAALTTSVISCLVSQPGDMILTATYMKRDKRSLGIRYIIKKIYKEYGLGGFFLGLQARMLHVVTIVTSQLVIYDIIKVALGLVVTGSM